MKPWRKMLCRGFKNLFKKVEDYAKIFLKYAEIYK